MDSKITAALYLYAFFVLGVFLLIAPWTPVWDEGTMLILPTAIGGWVRGGWVRGVVSAVGALDLIVALQLAAELWGRLERSG